MDALSLQNVITFPPDGAFIIDSGLAVAGDQRVDFKFNEAGLKVNGTRVPFPPVGQGWCASSRVLQFKAILRMEQHFRCLIETFPLPQVPLEQGCMVTRLLTERSGA
jgi:hypothetical protein